MMKRPNNQKGMSLIEFMVAITLASILSLGTYQIFSSNSASSRMLTSASEVQENGLFAIELLARAVRSADYWGCAGNLDMDEVTNNLNPANYSSDSDLNDLFSFGEGIEGTNNNSDTTDLTVDGTDTLTIRGVQEGDSIQLEAAMGAGRGASLKVSENSGLEVGDIVFVSDCRGGGIFQATNVNQSGGFDNVIHNTNNTTFPGNYNPGNCSGANAHCLSRAYPEGASIYRPSSTRFSIRLASDGTPSLYRTESVGSNTGTSTGTRLTYEMVRGIANLQLTWGIDSNDDAQLDSYTAGTPSDWSEVVAVRISVLAESESGVTDGGVSYHFNGSTITPAASDTKLRREYTTIVALRNRL